MPSHAREAESMDYISKTCSSKYFDESFIFSLSLRGNMYCDGLMQWVKRMWRTLTLDPVEALRKE